MDINYYSSNDLGLTYNKPSATNYGDVEQDTEYTNPSGYVISEYMPLHPSCFDSIMHMEVTRLKRTYNSQTQEYTETTEARTVTCYIRWYYQSGNDYVFLADTRFYLPTTQTTLELGLDTTYLMANATHFRVYVTGSALRRSIGEVPSRPTTGTWDYISDCIATIKTGYYYTSADDEDYLRSEIVDCPIPTLMTESMPLSEWRVKKGTVTHELLPTYKLLLDGAFKNAQNLSVVRIPDTVLKIGEYAFVGTQVERVVLNKNCVYSKKAFPTGTKFFYYIE